MPGETEPRIVVADASALVAALTGGAESGEWARQALLGAAIAVPEAGLVEAANVLRRLVLRGVVTSLEATLAHRDLLDLPVETWSYRLLASRAWELRESVTIPDGTYVALAELLDAPLLTGDERLARSPGTRCRFLLP